MTAARSTGTPATGVPGPASTAGGKAAARPRRPLAVRLLLLVAALVVALLVAEGLVRIFLPQPLSGSWREVSPGGYAVNRAGGTARHEFRGRVVEYRFNEQRLRGGPIEPGRFHVLCLGDSFTFGWLVPEEATYLQRMQQHADAALGGPRVQFLNGGAGGWGTSACLAFLEDQGDVIRPDAVLFFLNSWDIGRSLHTGIYEFVDPCTDEGRRGLRRGTPPQQVSRTSRLLTHLPGYRWLLEHSHLLQLLRNVVVKVQTAEPSPAAIGGEGADAGGRSAPLGRDDERDRRSRDLGRALFLRAKEWCDARKVPLWVVTTGRPNELPADGRGTPSGHLEATMAFKAVAPAFFREAGIFFADTTEQVTRDCGGDFRNVEIPDGGHPDVEGCRIIGLRAWEAIEPELRRAQR